jgi:aspartate 1-decarboxylase
MLRRMMKSKIHRATVTRADLHYVGSISIDHRLMVAAEILPYEQVVVLDLENGARFETYAIEGAAGEICLNGAAARLVTPGDRVILITYGDYTPAELDEYIPIVIHVDDQNRPVGTVLESLDTELTVIQGR